MSSCRGALVLLFGSRIPDLVVGTIIASVVVKGGFEIIREANEAKEKVASANPYKPSGKQG